MAAYQQQQYATSLQSVPGHPVFLQSQMVQRPTSKYLNVTGHAPGVGQVFICCLWLFLCIDLKSQLLKVADTVQI